MTSGNWKIGDKNSDIVGLSKCSCNDGGCGNDGKSRQDFCFPLPSWSKGHWNKYVECRVERGIELFNLTLEDAHETAIKMARMGWRNAVLPERDKSNSGSSNECAHCGGDQGELVPFVAKSEILHGSKSWYWLHHECHPAWSIERSALVNSAIKDLIGEQID